VKGIWKGPIPLVEGEKREKRALKEYVLVHYVLFQVMVSTHSKLIMVKDIGFQSNPS